MRKYTEQHEWADLQDDIVIVGITDHAQHQLGDIVYVELPTVGKHIQKGQEVAVVESVKAASEVYTPLTGEVVEVNEALQNQPNLINTAAEAEGWFFKVRPSTLSDFEALLDESAYQELIGE